MLVTSADLVDRALRGEDIGTWFDPHPEPVSVPVTGPIRRGSVAHAADTLGG